MLIGLQLGPALASPAVAAGAEPPWLADFFGAMSDDQTNGPAASDLSPVLVREKLATATDATEDLESTTETVSLSAISPGFLVGAVAVTIASRGRIQGERGFVGGTPTVPLGQTWRPTFLAIRAVFARPRRAG